MIVELLIGLSAVEVAKLKGEIQQLIGETGEIAEVRTQLGHYFVVTPTPEFDVRRLGALTGVSDVFVVAESYKLVSRRWKRETSSVRLQHNGVIVGEGLTIMAGPCAVESEEQVDAVAQHLRSHGIRVMRGGAFKPRSSPYSFRGLGLPGLKLLSAAARRHDLAVISEVLDVSQIEPMADYVDIFQVGTRNSQNFALLEELGKIDRPVLIKRGMSGTLEELLQSAEYVFSSGNEQLMLCERGIRTFEKAYRNSLDLNAVPYLKEKSHLPVIVDPSHGIGIRRFVEPMGLAAVAAGADGLLVEIHPRPHDASSDGAQTLDFTESARFFLKAQMMYETRTRLSSLMGDLTQGEAR